MATDKVQGTYPDDYRWAGAPSGMAMQEYLRDGDIDRKRALVAAADRLVGLLVALSHPAEMHTPTQVEIDEAITAYEQAKAEARP